jgi:uncharacterized protein (DUF58 family)
MNRSAPSRSSEVSAGPRPGAAGSLFSEAFLHKLQQLSIVAKRIAHSGNRGERKTRRGGAGLEFADHREYSAGDDLRRIDWNLYGRIGRPLVRLFDEDQELVFHLLVDTSASMGIGSRPKLHLACETAAALAYIGLSGRDRVSLQPFAADLHDGLGPLRGRRQIHSVLRFLDALRPGGGTELAAAAASFVARQRRKGVVVILSDFFAGSGAEAALDRLRANRFEPVVVHITAWEDRRAPDEDELLVVDSETGRECAVTLTDKTRLAYELEISSRGESLMRFCRQRSVPCFAVSAEQPFDTVVLRLLRIGGLLS